MHRYLRTLVFGSAIALVALSAFVPASSKANPVDWSNSQLYQGLTGLTNPLFAVAFNPQPEPPAATALGFLQIGQSAIQRTISGVNNPQGFQILFSAGGGGGSGPAVGVDSFGGVVPGVSFSQLTLEVDLGIDTILARLDFTTSSGGAVDINAVAFNPQPEPPAFGALNSDSFGLDFSFTSLSDAIVTITFTERDGQTPIQLSEIVLAVPEPALIGVMLLGIAMAFAGQRRRLG